ncbi:MAG: NAD(P)/FAD-dependent oxidoreductase [Mesorhizobium sp.]|uniref:NAD(P)/FAD-dependent oxidoreductase n=1 Tax=Mesorhizobium sp. TaxID=1871066 RepID=UPI00122488C8|nr:NAD(P)/FAD-dependent oxidoreductase [Mesorhizobium sp.]TIN03505.1 MAG: NAD(P)/FAD-dependent oxidoreductase [Mesorhizobium sp.]
MQSYDVVIIGAGAAGMMCAGGRCNFTNIHASPKNFLSGNPHFCISALSRYTQRDFIALVERHRIAYHEKTLGQLFCDGSARQIIDMLISEMQGRGVELALSVSVEDVRKTVEGFALTLSTGLATCQSLVVACGGKSIPKMGATGFGYEVAERFGLAIVETRPALVPLTFDANTLERLVPLAGNAVDAEVACGKTRFSEAMLFTHRGVSGPSILQISSYWREGDEIRIAMLPGVDVADLIRVAKRSNGRQAVQTVLANHLPKRLAQSIAERTGIDGNLADLSDGQIKTIAAAVNDWRIKPAGSEGYRTAEVTLGGVDTNGLDQKTMQAKSVPGLFFIGEAVDVTGWLGGYNFQWAWSSGWVAGQAA